MIALLVALTIANPADESGFTAGGAAVGGAAVAAPVAGTAGFYDAAAAPFARDVEIALGYTMTAPRLLVNGAHHPVRTAETLALGAVLPIDLGLLGRLGASIAIAKPNDWIIRAHLTPSDTAWFLFYDNRLERISVDAALAYGVTLDGWDLGAAAGVTVLGGIAGSDTAYQVSFVGDYHQADGVVRADVPLVTAPTAALSAHRGPLSLAATLRAPISFGFAFAGVTDVTIGAVSGDVYSALIATDFYTPLRAVVAASWVEEEWSAHAALELHRWSAAPSLAGGTVLAVDFPGLPFASPGSPVVPQRLRDVWLPRLGVERRFEVDTFMVTARGGAWYAPTPVTSTAGGVLLDSDRVGVSLGAGITTAAPFLIWPAPLGLDANLAYVSLAPRTIRARTPGGDTDLRISGGVWSWGVALVQRF